MIQLDQFLTRNKFWQYCHHLIWTDRLAQKTVRRKLAGLKKFCQWAVEKGWLKENPFEEEQEGRKGQEGEEGMIGEIRGIRKAILKLGLLLVSLVIGFTTLRVSLIHLPSPPEVPKAIPFPQGQILSQTSGFGRFGEFGGFEEFGGISLTASESALLANLTKQGQLVLPESLGIEAKEITLKTADGYDGSITFNPDGQGTINFLFEGQSPKEAVGVGGFVNIQNANLVKGNLISASVANDQTGYNFLQFQGGVDLSNRFTVDGQGNIEASGSLNLGSGQITSSKNLVFSPQDQPTLVLAPKQSLLKGNLAISGQLYDGGLGIFGTTGEPLPQTFDFTKELTIEFEFLTGAKDLIIKFNLNKEKKQYYQAVWQTNGEFAIQTCNPVCSAIGSIAHYPFEESGWHHGRIHINDSYLIWELDLSSQKVSVPVQITTTPLLSSGYIEFSENFAAIADLKVSQGGNPILTSGHGRIGGNLEVSGGIRVSQLSDTSSSTHVCRNALGDLATCAADYSEWYPVASDTTNDENGLKTDLSGSLVSITNIPNPVDDPTARYMAAPSKSPYDRNILGVLANSSAGANGKKLNDSYQPLVLAGRVPVKVSGVNGPIEVGDAITSSETSGVGMRATEAGMVVGSALEPSGGSGKVLVFVNPGWWEPEKIAETRNTKHETREAKPSSGFTELVDSTESNQENNPIQINSLIIEQLRSAGQEEIAKKLIAQTQEKTTILESEVSNLLTRVEHLEEGNGEGEAAGLTPPNPSPTSGKLLADVEAFIQELQEVSVSATNGITNYVNISEDNEINGYLSNSTSQESPLSGATLRGDLDYSLPQLTVTGQTSLGQTTIAGNLLVDSSLQIGVNSINSLNNTLFLQNYGFGGIDILAGKVKIDPQGNLAVAGNVEIEKDLKVKRSLFASLIKPLEGEDVVIDGNLKAKDGIFDKIVIASASKTPEVFLPTERRDSSTSGVEELGIITNATAGTAILPTEETELTIVNEAITNDSLVYITPLSPTENKVLFVKAKKGTIQCPETPEVFLAAEGGNSSTSGVEKTCLPQPGYFTVAIDQPIGQDINLNWWVIN